MKQNSGKQLAKKMLIALVCGLIAGFGCIIFREHLNSSGQGELWKTINNILFQDITAEGATSAIGIFYIIGQLFVNALQLIIVPMVFVSITLAICTITDTKKLGRISSKTILTFFTTTVCALIFAGVVSTVIYHLGLFNTVDAGKITVQQGTTGSNPLNIIVSIIPNNFISAFTTNGNVLAIVFLAVVTGLSMNALEEQTKTLKKVFEEVSKIISLFLTFVINKFAPFAIFCLLTRTFAIYGIDSLKPALAYVVTVIIALFVYLFVAYPIYLMTMARVNPKPFMKKAAKVALFGFSTSSSAASLPLNRKTTVEELGVGLIQVSDIYHEAVKYLKEGNFKVKDHVDIETDLIEKTFTNKELCESIKKTNDPNLLDLIDPKVLREKTEEIIRIIEEIPKADEIVAMLEKVHGVKSLEDIGFTPDMKEKTARVAPYIRDRITFMRILKFYDFYDDVIK